MYVICTLCTQIGQIVVKKPNINISKTYIVDKTVDQSFEKLDAIISSPYNNSTYSTTGNLDSDDPLLFLLRLKRTFYSTMPADIFSTKLSIKLTKADNKTRIDIITLSNPVIFVFLFFSLLNGFIMTLRDKSQSFFYGILFTLLIAFLILGLDRMMKNMLIAGFEEDFAINGY